MFYIYPDRKALVITLSVVCLSVCSDPVSTIVTVVFLGKNMQPRQGFEPWTVSSLCQHCQAAFFDQCLL